MKKILCILAVLMLVCALSAAASAADCLFCQAEETTGDIWPCSAAENPEHHISATCTENGTDCFVCSIHGHITLPTDTIPHDYSVRGETKAPTCKDEGYTVFKCSMCDDEKHGEIKPKTTVHTWDTGEVIKEPDYANDGQTIYTCTVCGETETRNEPPRYQRLTSIALDRGFADMYVGDTLTIIVSVAPDNAKNKSIEWSSSNAAVASVANGAVTAKGVGTTTIKAAAKDGSGQAAYCTITVYQRSTDPGDNKKQYTLSLRADPSTMGTVAGSGTYDENLTVNAIATPNDGYQFTGWYDAVGNKIPNANQLYPIRMTHDTELIAHFAAKSSPIYPDNYFYVAGNSNPSGIAWILGANRSYLSGTQVTLTIANVLDGYIFKGWTLSNGRQETGNSITFTVDGNINAIANFERSTETFAITYCPEDAKETDEHYQTKYYGVPVKLYSQIYTKDGYVQSGWKDVFTNQFYGFGSTYSRNANLVLKPTWSVPGQHTLKVTFNADGKGKVHTGNTTVENGMTFKVKDNESATFHFDTVEDIYPYNIRLNGVSKGSYSTYTVRGQAYDQELYIEFGSIYDHPKTGDSNDVIIYSVLAFTSLASLTGMILSRRKKNGRI